MTPITLSKGYFKRGSTWTVQLTRKDNAGAAVDMTGLTTRAMFRDGSVDGPVVATLTDGNGITIADPTTGVIALSLTATQSALFTAGSRVYFDIEQTDPVSGYVWQSPTYRFPVDQEVTRD